MNVIFQEFQHFNFDLGRFFTSIPIFLGGFYAAMCKLMAGYLAAPWISRGYARQSAAARQLQRQ